ncbi:undecaprenyl/decaprenyl-phosphate alpha-N-acetylglucosaminyl 1-phosphate transferase [Candidatus Poribacteria bacterium]|nr:undecaprenyl/decaprenyl-phosphate alpha-N-acetylglucosaminyl 1-phosphate transferase [Candidatus Poribacteria bacterium]
MEIILGFIAFSCALALIPLMQRIAHRYRFMLDHPSARRIHRQKMPRTGGIGMAVPFTLVVFAGMLFSHRSYPSSPVLGVLAAGVIGLLIGVRDDMHGMNAYQKFAGQLIVTLALMASGLRIERMVFPLFWDTSLPFVASFLATLFWVAATMNAVNLIDGMDGLAGGLLLIASLGMLFLAYLTGNAPAMLIAAGIAGVCLGFLPYNFHPASVFMGDCGSMFLGATFAGLSLLLTHNGTTTGSVWVPTTLLTVPFLDTALAMIRRKLRGQNLFTADTEHLHHQLLDFGLSQPQVVLVFYTLGVLTGCLAIVCFHGTDVGAMSIVTVVGSVLLIGGLLMTHQHGKQFASHLARGKVVWGDRHGKQFTSHPARHTVVWGQKEYRTKEARAEVVFSVPSSKLGVGSYND